MDAGFQVRSAHQLISIIRPAFRYMIHFWLSPLGLVHTAITMIADLVSGESLLPGL